MIANKYMKEVINKIILIIIVKFNVQNVNNQIFYQKIYRTILINNVKKGKLVARIVNKNFKEKS
jgi:hypothetical protein